MRELFTSGSRPRIPPATLPIPSMQPSKPVSHLPGSASIFREAELLAKHRALHDAISSTPQTACLIPNTRSQASRIAPLTILALPFILRLSPLRPRPDDNATLTFTLCKNPTNSLVSHTSTRFLGETRSARSRTLPADASWPTPSPYDVFLSHNAQDKPRVLLLCISPAALASRSGWRWSGTPPFNATRPIRAAGSSAPARRL